MENSDGISRARWSSDCEPAELQLSRNSGGQLLTLDRLSSIPRVTPCSTPRYQVSSVHSQNYDAGQVVVEINTLGNRTSIVFDVAGQRTTLEDARGNRHSFAFDAAGEETALIDPLSRRTTSGYGVAGRQDLRIDARGNRSTYSFDACNQKTGRSYANGTRVKQAFDAVGNRTLMHDSTVRYTSTFDKLNRTEMYSNPDRRGMTYSFDAASQRQATVDPGGGRFTSSYRTDGLIDSVENPQNDRTSYSYDDAGRRKVKKLANGTRASMTYDAGDNLSALYNMKSDSSVISSFDYAVDKVGNRTSVVEDNADRVTWSYDSSYQLTRKQQSSANSYDDEYQYDSVDNRTEKIADGARTVRSAT